MEVREILKQRFQENSEQFTILLNAIIVRMNAGVITQRDIDKSPDSVINKLISELLTVKGNATTGLTTIDNKVFQGDGTRYKEISDTSTTNPTILNLDKLQNVEKTDLDLLSNLDTLGYTPEDIKNVFKNNLDSLSMYNNYTDNISSLQDDILK